MSFRPGYLTIAGAFLYFMPFTCQTNRGAYNLLVRYMQLDETCLDFTEKRPESMSQEDKNRLTRDALCAFASLVINTEKEKKLDFNKACEIILNWAQEDS